MDLLKKIKSDLAEFIEPEKAEFLPKFFKAFPGGYGEGDKFIGVRVPYQRKVAKRHFRDFALKSFGVVLQSDVHEYRLTGLFMLGYRFEKTKTEAGPYGDVPVPFRIPLHSGLPGRRRCQRRRLGLE